MIQHHFQIAIRFLRRNRVHSMVSILGLAVGMAGALLIFEYVLFHKSFDAFHTHYENIYRITARDSESAAPQRATTVQWVGPGFKQAFPEVKEYSLIAPLKVFVGDTWAGHEDKRIDGEKIFFADAGFFNIFTFPLVSGNPGKALQDPFSVVITESTAKKLFGDSDPVGASLTIDTHHNLGPDGYGADNLFKVAGVVKDVPADSHFQFDILISYSTLWRDIRETSLNMFWDFAYCYVLLEPGTDVQALERKFKPLQQKTFGEGVHADQGYLNLQPLRDIHRYSNLRGELQVNSDGRTLDFLFAIGICILLSAYVNHINLSTAKSAERKIEVGIRKVVGASRLQLAVQLMTESLLVSAFAGVLAMVVAQFSIPVIERVFNLTWPPRPDWLSVKPLLYGVTVIFTGAIFSAAYPVYILTTFKPLNVFTSATLSMGQRRWTLGKHLMIVEFTFCIILSVGTYVMYQQLRHMHTLDLGMNINNVLVVKDYGFQPYHTYANFKNRISTLSFVSAVGASSAPPGQAVTMLGLRHSIKGIDGANRGELKMISADEGFFDVLKVNLIAGRMVDRSDSASATRAVINEAAAHLMGYQNPRDAVHAVIPKFKDRHDVEVIGVVKNYNQISLRETYEPTLYTVNSFWDDAIGWNRRYIFIRLEHIKEENFAAAIAAIEQAWKDVVTDDPFQYFFLDNFFHQHHRGDQVTGALFIFFSVYSLFITSIGLFGLVAFTLLRRTREIGIRKILGANASSIILLLSKDYLKILVIAVMFSIPISLWAAHQWLTQYAFRIRPGVTVFLFPVLLVCFIITGTLVAQTWRAANTNPVDSLKAE